MNSLLSLEEVMVITGNTSGIAALQDIEAKALYDCCLSVPRNGLVVEVGCQLGRSSTLINQMALSIGFHDIHIDPWTEQPGWMKEWMETMYKVGGHRDHAFSVLCMRTEQAKEIISRLGPIDFAYIDGDHEKDSALIDLHSVAQMVRSGGYLAVHDYDPVSYPDYSFPGVVEAMREYLDNTWEEVGVYNNMGVWRRK